MDRTTRTIRRHSVPFRYLVALPFLALAASLTLLSTPATGQDNVLTGTSNGVSSIRLAVADFKPIAAADPQYAALKQTFDTTLYADLATAGIFDIVSKSLMPPGNPGTPSEAQLQSYSNAPASAAYVAFGSIGVTGSKLLVNGFLFDAKNLQYPQVIAKQYSEDPARTPPARSRTASPTRLSIAWEEGTGIAESKIYYAKILGSFTKEIWAMDYDGANQHAITHLGTDSISPRVSPDNTRLAFASFGKYGFQLKMYSLLLDRYINFPAGNVSSQTPAWAPSGNELAYAAAPNGSFEIWIADSNGNLGRRITSFHGGNVSPTYNPKTGAQIAFISDRTGLPQLYIMDSDGSNVRRLTDMGYASSPSWSPNGQFIAFAWERKYGPGAPGGQDIYIIQVAPNADGTYTMSQLTHDGGRCDFPSWSPDNRHIVYANSADGRPDHWRI